MKKPTYIFWFTHKMIRGIPQLDVQRGVELGMWKIIDDGYNNTLTADHILRTELQNIMIGRKLL